MIFLDEIACAGEIFRRRQEKGEGRSGTTDEPFDEPTTKKVTAPAGLRSGGRPRRRRARPYFRYALPAAPGGSRAPERNAGCFHLRKSCSPPRYLAALIPSPPWPWPRSCPCVS